MTEILVESNLQQNAPSFDVTTPEGQYVIGLNTELTRMQSLFDKECTKVFDLLNLIENLSREKDILLDKIERIKEIISE
jgi:hypothetical protein